MSAPLRPPSDPPVLRVISEVVARSAPPEQAARRPSLVRRIWASLGPGVVSGAADDDPSGIATYSIAGAQFGTSLLWMALFTWPLMAAVQMMCARIGMVMGEGLAGALRKRHPRWLIIVAAIALLAANTINIAADLAGMADAAEMLSGIGSRYFVLLFGFGIAGVTIWVPYRRFAAILKWLTLSLFAYVATAFAVGIDWKTVGHDALVPKLPRARDEWAMLLAILGTTISPYLFFWQASEEVEEEKVMGRVMLAARLGATDREIVDRRIDVGFGALFSNIVMFFIILTTALTLHRHGVVSIETSREAAEALAPLAGRFASVLYTVGLIGVGLLAIPTLTGSAAYALAETFDWEQGLERNLRDAPAFYGVVVVSTLVGMGLNFGHVSPVRALFWAAVINGLLAPALLIAILMVASHRKLMQNQPSSMLSRVLVALTIGVLVCTAVGMFAL